MSRLQPLLAAAPSYVQSCLLIGKDQARFTLNLELPGAAAPIPVHLAVRQEDERIRVAPDPSLPAALKLPACCPERHIQPDGSFCLSYDQSLTAALEDTKAWWDWLCRFLQLQWLANRRGTWPEDCQLDHGAAGPIILGIRKILAELPEATRARLGKDGAVLDHMPLRLNMKAAGSGHRLTNGRARCACGDGWLRRDCLGCHRVALIVALRAKRKEALDQFWSDIRKQGHKCCGGMRECALRH